MASALLYCKGMYLRVGNQSSHRPAVMMAME